MKEKETKPLKLTRGKTLSKHGEQFFSCGVLETRPGLDRRGAVGIIYSKTTFNLQDKIKT